MKKSDLKTGMRVRLRNGEIYIVMLDTGSAYPNIIVSTNGFNSLGDYDDDMKCRDGLEFDIIEVYEQYYLRHLLNFDKLGELVYPRKPETKEMTLKEVIKELGYEIKIIKEN